jgi:hypothetical protein
MKYISTLVILLSLICNSKYYSQKNPKLRIKQENSKGLSLKVKGLKPIEKNGKTSWAVTSFLTNHSRDTLLYFSYPGCEPVNFMAMASVETITLFPDFECDTAVKQTVIALPPSAQRAVNLVISSKQPVTSSFAFKVILWIHRAKNLNERIPEKDLIQRTEGEILLASNLIKVEAPDETAQPAADTRKNN